MNLEPLSYVFGALLGDGCFHYRNNRKSGELYITSENKEISTRCYFSMRDHFGDSIRLGWPHEKITANDVLMHEVWWFNTELMWFMRNATADKSILPEYIWTAPRECKLAMLAGLMDTDGSIPTSHSSYMLDFWGTEKFAEQVPELFRCVGIKVGKISWDCRADKTKIGMRFHPVIKDAVEQGFYFRCRRKQYRLKQYMRRVGICPYNGPADYISEMERGGDPSKY